MLYCMLDKVSTMQSCRPNSNSLGLSVQVPAGGTRKLRLPVFAATPNHTTPPHTTTPDPQDDSKKGLHPGCVNIIRYQALAALLLRARETLNIPLQTPIAFLIGQREPSPLLSGSPATLTIPPAANAVYSSQV